MPVNFGRVLDAFRTHVMLGTQIALKRSRVRIPSAPPSPEHDNPPAKKPGVVVL